MNKLAHLILRVQEALEKKTEYPQPVDAKEATPDSMNEAKPLTKKEEVLQALLLRSNDVEATDLPGIEDEMVAAFEAHKNDDYFTDFASTSYFRLLDLRERPDSRVVVVGDIHSDFLSLAAILLKLSVSDYDYFENGFFVFMGDYLDRGMMLFEPLLLLLDMKKILGERMVMLRGNHELIDYDDATQLLTGRVIPQDSVPLLNKFCSENKPFLQSFAYFYRTLPTYVYLKVADQNVLLTHGAVPRDIFLNSFCYDTETGAIVFEKEFLYELNAKIKNEISDDSLTTCTRLCNGNLLRLRNEILNDMIWGDPSTAEEKYQVNGRYEFGSKQFESYATKNKLSRVFRSHEPEATGIASFFDNRLFTVFSTGGVHNQQSGYEGLQPAFAIVRGDGSYALENSNLYRVSVGEIIELTTDLFDEQVISLRAADKYNLNDEFCCSTDTALQLLATIEEIKSNFSPI